MGTRVKPQEKKWGEDIGWSTDGTTSWNEQQVRPSRKEIFFIFQPMHFQAFAVSSSEGNVIWLQKPNIQGERLL